MENCLVTKMKGVVGNDSLSIFGYLKNKVYTTSEFIIGIGEGLSNANVKSVDGTTFDVYNASNSKIASGVISYDVPDGGTVKNFSKEGFFHIKYSNLASLTLYAAIVSTESLKYTSLTRYTQNLENTGLTQEVKSLPKNATNIRLYSAITGDISIILDIINLTTFTSGRFTGDILTYVESVIRKGRTSGKLDGASWHMGLTFNGTAISGGMSDNKVEWSDTGNEYTVIFSRKPYGGDWIEYSRTTIAK